MGKTIKVSDSIDFEMAAGDLEKDVEEHYGEHPETAIKINKAKKKLRNYDGVIPRKQRKKEIDELVLNSQDPDSMRRSMESLYGSHQEKYKERHPVKAWTNNQMADVFGPIEKILPEMVSDYLRDSKDYGDSGGVIGSLASIVLDPTAYIPFIGTASKAPKAIKLIKAISSKIPSVAAKGAMAGAAYGATKQYGENNLSEEDDQGSIAGSAVTGGLMGGALAKVGSAIMHKIKGPLDEERILAMSKKEINDLSSGKKRNIAKTIDKTLELKKEKLDKAFEGSFSNDSKEAASNLSESIKNLYKGKDAQFKSLYDGLIKDFAESKVDHAPFKPFMKEIHGLSKSKAEGALHSKKEYNIKDLLDIKNHLEQGIGGEIDSSAKRVKMGNKKLFEEVMDKSLMEQHPELHSAYKSVSEKYKNEMVPLRKNKQIKNLGQGKTTEINPNFLAAASEGNEAIVNMLSKEDLSSLKKAVVSSKNGNTKQAANFFAKLPKKQAQIILGDDYNDVVNYLMSSQRLKELRPDAEKRAGIIDTIRQKLQNAVDFLDT